MAGVRVWEGVGGQGCIYSEFEEKAHFIKEK